MFPQPDLAENSSTALMALQSLCFGNEWLLKHPYYAILKVPVLFWGSPMFTCIQGKKKKTLTFLHTHIS